MNPITKASIRRFKAHRRGFYSFWILFVFYGLSLIAELIAHNHPIMMGYQGKWYFPLTRFYASTEFGLFEPTAPQYKILTQSSSFKEHGGWAIFPLIPFAEQESDDKLDSPPPTRPSTTHWLGTDDRGRDLLVRLIYGFRNSMTFALLSCVLVMVVAYSIGAIQGYLGGWTDLIGQRLTEIWNALPILYVIIFLLSIFSPGLSLLLMVWVAFQWVGLSAYVRAEVLRVRKQDYIIAAKAMGFSLPRILFHHILPNTLTPLITFSPFIIASSIGSLAALDYLGLGLPPPAASWGELLRQGKENLQSWWLSLFPFLSLFLTLLLLNFVGESIRASWDARSTD